MRPVRRSSVHNIELHRHLKKLKTPLNPAPNAFAGKKRGFHAEQPSRS